MGRGRGSGNDREGNKSDSQPKGLGFLLGLVLVAPTIPAKNDLLVQEDQRLVPMDERQDNPKLHN